MPDLRISTDLTLPADAVTQTFGILAKRGSGKTYCMLVLAEELLKARHQVGILDPVGVCWGLRSSADGQSEGLPIVILGGEHGDIPLEAAAGQLVADMVIDERISVVLDLSLFSKTQQRRFVADFGERIYQRNRAPLHLMLDEADEFAPQSVRGESARMVGAIEDLVRRGRARGIGVTLVTQRAAVLNKDVLTQIEVLIALKTTGPQDRAALDEWVKYHGDPEKRTELLRSLASLSIGEAWVWSPGWLDVFKRVRIRQRETFDSSATPKSGSVAVEPYVLAPVDLEQLRTRMAETIERAKTDDPKELQRRIRELETQLLNEPYREPVIERIEVPVLTDETVAALTAQVDSMCSTAMRLLDLGGEIRAALVAAKPLSNIPEIVPTRESRAPGHEYVRIPRNKPSPPSSSPVATDIKISGPQQRILDALAEMEAVGLHDMARSNVAVYADASPKSSAFGNNLGALRSAGLIDYPAPNRVCLTDAGRQAAGPSTRSPRSLLELHDSWLRHLSGPQGRILGELIAVYPDAIPRDALAGLTGASATSSAYGNNLGHLRGLGLIDYPQRGMVAATQLLFPDGLR